MMTRMCSHGRLAVGLIPIFQAGIRRWRGLIREWSSGSSCDRRSVSGDNRVTKHGSAFARFSVMASEAEDVVIAIGGNVGNRVRNFMDALRMMKKAGIDIVSHAGLYESAPAYVLNQPRFLNSAVRAMTRLDPYSLLQVLKGIERDLGRVADGIRYGPRAIDLDILFYGQLSMSSEVLTIPHPRIWERPFVLAPLMDLYNTKLADSCKIWSARFERARHAWELVGGEKQLGQESLKRVIPLGDKLWYWSDKTYVMGILNVTPDSFSDGGKFISVQDAVAHVQALVDAGADIIDVGAQSTRPFASRITTEEELGRLLPVLEAVGKLASLESFYLCVDTFDSMVAREAVKSGVHMVNDVSGGCLDPDMYRVVAELGVPYVLMHMRGNPTTMLNEDNTRYRNVSGEVAQELCTRLEQAESLGVPGWCIITDPGLGFSKTAEQNIDILQNLSLFRSGLAAWSLAASKGPILIGPSRKSFLGKICRLENSSDQDAATAGVVVAGVALGADIVRVHNVKASVEAVRLADTIFRPKGSHYKGFRNTCHYQQAEIV
eukprot:c4796_g1_i1 orf=865-2508(-)